MQSQEQEKHDAQDVPTIRSEGGRRNQVLRLQKKKKKKNNWSPVSRHHVVAAMVARSQVVRASLAARRTPPAARLTSPATRRTSPTTRQTSPAPTPPAAAVVESLRTPTFIHNDYVPHSESPAPMDDHMHEDDVEGDSEHNVEDDSEHSVDLAPMVAAMKSKFNKYWYGSYMTLAIPVIVDPRFKLKYVEFRLRKAFVNDPQPRIDRVKNLFRKLFNEYFSQLNNGNNNSSEQAGQVHSQMVTTDDDMFNDWDDHLNEGTQGQTTTELDRYLSESPISRSEEFDILKWWSANSVTYPILAALARDVLATPASTVASESAFSMGGRVVNDFRSRLNVESVEALICSQDWYRGSASHQRMSAITDLVDLHDTEVDSPLAEVCN